MPKSWIYRADRTELIRQLRLVELDTSGTVNEFRRRLSDYCTSHPEHRPATMPDIPAIHVALPPTPEPRAEIPDLPAPATHEDTPAKVMNQMRKWGCHFDGKDPVSFLERLEELQREYGYDGALLLRGLPEMLRGDALLWYRNNRAAWDTWEDFSDDFRDYYLPRRYYAQLRRDIQARTQGADEPYRKYATDVLTMMRRAGGYVEEDQLDLLYENMHPRYKLYVRRESVRRTAELRRQAEELEHINAQCRDRQPVPKPSASSAAAAYDKNECCWRCKQRGHTRFDCRRIARKFCSQCGKDGVYTRECHPPAGNATRTGDAATAPRSSE
jgi:hypothetical protein